MSTRIIHNGPPAWLRAERPNRSAADNSLSPARTAHDKPITPAETRPAAEEMSDLRTTFHMA